MMTTVETLHNGFAGVFWAEGEKLARGRGSSNSRLVFFYVFYFFLRILCACAWFISQFLQIGSIQVAKIHAVVGTIPGPREHVLDVLMYCYL